MAQQVRRQMEYVDGTAARKLYEAPARRIAEPYHRPTPSRRPEVRPQPTVRKRKRLSNQAKKTLAFNSGYMVFMMVMVTMVIISCAFMLYMDTKITAQQNNITALEAELEDIQDDNAAHRIRLNNMYSLDEVYDVATNELGMVYAKKGQIIYYESADEDYVKQYQDVPGSNK